MIVLYVDDGLVAATDEDLLGEFMSRLKDEFKVTEKPASYFLGYEIKRNNDGTIKMSQEHYTEKLLKKFGWDNCKSVLTPILKEPAESGKVREADELDNDKYFPYREAVGALMYLMTGTRPDIAYAVGFASRSLENPSRGDWVCVTRIFRYLKGTSDFGIHYRPDYKKGILEAYSDADLGGDEVTGRSTRGVVCLYAGGAISWLSQRQTSVAISTTEAEVVAASEAAREVMWLKRLLSGITNLEKIPELQIDKQLQDSLKTQNITVGLNT